MKGITMEIKYSKNQFFTPWTYSIISLLTLIIIGGFSLISSFNSTQYLHDLEAWNSKLKLVSESRSADISRFVSANFSELRSTAENASLRLYLTELQMAGGEQKPAANPAPNSGEAAQKSYLRNLLIFTAQHGGFSGAANNVPIPANIPATSNEQGGIAIVDGKGQIVVSTSMGKEANDLALGEAKNIKSGEEKLIDIRKDKNGAMYIGFAVPVFSLQGEKNADSEIGKIIAIKVIDDSFFALLKQAGTSEKTLETLLLRKENNQYLSRLQDSSAPLERYLEEGRANASRPIGGLYEYTDYRGANVLATESDIAGTDWKLISKIDTGEAFAESGAYRLSMVIIFTLITAIITMVIMALWWYSYSRHALMASSYFRKLATIAQEQEKLLALVADNQPETIYIVDSQNICRFSNQKLADAAGMSQSGITGKKLADILGAAQAGQIISNCAVASKANKTIYTVQSVKEEKEEKVIRSAYIPLTEIPLPNLQNEATEALAGTLVVEQDISEVFFERERRVNTLKQLVATLVNLVDKRDPFAANHSLMVSKLSEQVAISMGVNESAIETTKTAASLMNIGKIIVPKALLTKTSPLNDEEKTTIRDSMESAYNMLKDIPFDGPVAETTRQWQEKWDGSGRLGLAGEDILISARIIAVANAFIGMVSPRSWRNAINIDAANKFLLEQADTYFDKKVVISLINYMENQNGREMLEKFSKAA